MGRRTLYDQAYHLAEVKKLAEKGLIEREIADQFGISRATLSDWKNRYPGFLNALRAGKHVADGQVEAALFKCGIGGGKVREIHYKPAAKEGDPAIAIRIVECDIRPDQRACEFWLCNRAPNRWKRNPSPKMRQEFGRCEEKDPEKHKIMRKKFQLLLLEKPESQKIANKRAR